LIVDADPAECAGCYFIDGAWLYRIDVTQDTLRGSGRAIPDGFAVASGCQPGERRTFGSPFGDIAISWPDSTALGASLGSIRAMAEIEKLQSRDYVFLGFLPDRAIVRILRRQEIDILTNPLDKILRLVGYPSNIAEYYENPWEALATALGAAEDFDEPDYHDIQRLFQSRNENDLIALLPKEKESEETTDVALKRIAGLLR
jgi:hypothetical protein